MTLLSDIQQAQSFWAVPLTRKRFLIKVPLTIVELLNPNEHNLWLFDPTLYDSTDTNDYVYLVLFPNCEPDDEYLGDRGFKVGFNASAMSLPTTVRRGYKLTVFQPQWWIFQIVQRLALIASTSAYNQYTPLKVVDFCRPEALDDSTTSTFNGEVGTIRYGRIDITKIPATVRGFNETYILESWEFKFNESMLRTC